MYDWNLLHYQTERNMLVQLFWSIKNRFVNNPHRKCLNISLQTKCKHIETIEFRHHCFFAMTVSLHQRLALIHQINCSIKNNKLDMRSIMFDIFMRMSMSSILCLTFVECAKLREKFKAVSLSRQQLKISVQQKFSSWENSNRSEHLMYVENIEALEALWLNFSPCFYVITRWQTYLLFLH